MACLSVISFISSSRKDKYYFQILLSGSLFILRDKWPKMNDNKQAVALQIENHMTPSLFSLDNICGNKYM